MQLMLIGDDGVGKSELIRSYIGMFQSTEYLINNYEEFKVDVTSKDQPYTVYLTEGANGEEYDKLRPFAFMHKSVFIICFAVDNIGSLESVEKKWIPECKKHQPDIPIIIVGTKIDTRDSANNVEELAEQNHSSVSNDTGQSLANQSKAFAYLECSATNKEGVKTVFDKAIEAYSAPPIKKESPKKPCLLM